MWSGLKISDFMEDEALGKASPMLLRFFATTLICE